MVNIAGDSCGKKQLFFIAQKDRACHIFCTIIYNLIVLLIYISIKQHCLYWSIEVSSVLEYFILFPFVIYYVAILLLRALLTS